MKNLKYAKWPIYQVGRAEKSSQALCIGAKPGVLRSPPFPSNETWGLTDQCPVTSMRRYIEIVKQLHGSGLEPLLGGEEFLGNSGLSIAVYISWATHFT